MTFRIEEKFRIDKKQLFLFKIWLENNNAKKLFPRREITSIYFDNENKQMYKDSIEGVLPRSKIRLRYYNKKSGKTNFEKKISSVEGRFKISYQIEKFYDHLKYGFFDINYGICKPTTEVSYFRDYYLLYDQRITIDSSLKYKRAKFKGSNFMYDDDKIVVELKNNTSRHDTSIYSKFEFERIRFSKYCRSMGMVYKIAY